MDSEVAKKYLPAAHQALAAFPITPDHVELVWHAENITFRVTEKDTGLDYVLRLHRPDYHTLSELNSERAWTEALGATGIAIQIPLRTLNGEHFCLVEVSADEKRFAGMTQWTKGDLLSDYFGTDEGSCKRTQSYHQIGSLAAAIHNQSSRFVEPEGFERHALDTEGLVGEAPFWGRFWEHEALSHSERELLIQTRDQIREILDALGKTRANFGMIHADLHSDNIVVCDGVITPIDFDDAGYGWYIYEIAVALFDERGSADFATIQKAFLEGYSEQRALAEADLELLPIFFLIRGLALVGWVHQRPEHSQSQWFEMLRGATCSECERFMKSLND